MKSSLFVLLSALKSAYSGTFILFWNIFFFSAADIKEIVQTKTSFIHVLLK